MLDDMHFLQVSYKNLKSISRFSSIERGEIGEGEGLLTFG